MGAEILRHIFSNCKSLLHTCNHMFAAERQQFGLYSIVMPTAVSKKLEVPRHILRPPYINKTSGEDVAPSEPEIKSEEQILSMKRSCFLAKKILDEVAQHLQVGITTDKLDKIAHELCIKNNAYPSPLGYSGFPKSICTSVNNVACHGIPDKRPLKNGDLINIDVSVYIGGFHGDCSATFAVGEVDQKGMDLIRATEKCLEEAIAICCNGEYFSSIGEVITSTARELGFNVVPYFAGHGIGSYFHGPPEIFHCKNAYPGKMRTGMTFTIEPVLTQGDPTILILDDNWTAITTDNARTAQFEHTILINEDKAEILTQ